GTAVVDSAAALGLPLLRPDELEPLRASSAGLGELLVAILAGSPAAVIVGVGGTATVDGGAGLRYVLPRWPGGVPPRAACAVRGACDVRSPVVDAARVFARQKGASAAQAVELERRLTADRALAPYAELPGAGAGGGLGAALASLGGELVPGSELVLDVIGFDDQASRADLVVTGEGTVDETTFAGKAPGAVLARCERLGGRCVVVGGRVVGGEARALSGDPARAREDLAALGLELGRLGRGPGVDGRLA